MPHVITRTNEFRPAKWIGGVAVACAVAFVLGLSFGQHNANQATAKTTATTAQPAWCSGAQVKPFSQFVNDGNAPGSALYTEYRAELARMQGYGVQGTVDPGAVLLTLALRCY
jgi:hypothetical protein